MIRSSNHLRNVIGYIIAGVYYRDRKVNWDHVNRVSDYVIAEVAMEAVGGERDDSVQHRIRLVLWGTWSGGGIANSTANKICDALGLEYDDVP